MLSRRTFARAAALTAFAAAAQIGAGPTAFASPRDDTGIDPMSLVDPELRPMAEAMEQYARPPFSNANLAEIRAQAGAWSAAPIADVAYTQRTIAGAAGAPDIGIIVINASPGGSRPGILHTHGGGFILGSALSGVRANQELAKLLDCVIVSVDYRLAPETNYVGSIEDNYAGLKWLHANASELGVDTTRIAVIGESAGGGHAALLAITARDRGEIPLALQLLIYPMLDDRTGSTRPAPSHIGAFVWTAEQNRFGWRAFLGREPGGRNVPAAAAPARLENLRGLPPTFIGVGALDLFVHEDIEYSRRLIEAGVPTELVVAPGAFHGFEFVKTAQVAQRFEAAKHNALRHAFAGA